MATPNSEAAKAFCDALHLNPMDAGRVRALLTPQDWELIGQVHGLPFAYEVYSRLWHLRQLESAINTMAAVSEDIERHLRTLDMGVGQKGELLADEFSVDIRTRSTPRRTLKIYRPAVEDETTEPPEEAAEASNPHDLGKLPAPDDLEGRLSVASDFKGFCLRYFPEACNRWERPQDMMAQAVDIASNNRQLKFQSGERGRGVTTQIAIATLFEVLYGRFQYVTIVGRTRDQAYHILDTVKDELTRNQRLIRDFPEVCEPLRRAHGVIGRKLQTYRGQRTAIRWNSQSLKLPVIPGSLASGARIEAKGLKESFIGMARTMPGGAKIRPQYVLFDDPLNDEDAQSPKRLAEIESTIAAVLHALPGAKSTLSGVLYFTPDRSTPGEDISIEVNERAARVRAIVRRLASRFQREG